MKIYKLSDEVSFSKNIMDGIDYLRNTDLSKVGAGRIDIDGTRVYGFMQEYNTLDESKLESHKKYIDIQYVVEGTEIIGYSDIKNLEVSVPYNADSDIMFYHDAQMENLVLHSGEYAIFDVEDGHAPKLKNETSSFVRKVVLKIARY